MSVKPLTEHHMEFLSLKGGCTGSSESTLVKMPHCWKSHVTAQFIVNDVIQNIGPDKQNIGAYNFDYISYPSV